MTVHEFHNRLCREHVEEAAFAWIQWQRAVEAPQFAMKSLIDAGEVLSAHIDAIRVAGPSHWDDCNSLRDPEEPGQMFAATILAIESRRSLLQELIAACEHVPSLATALIGGFEWVSTNYLEGLVRDLLTSKFAWQRTIGVACCASRRVDCGAALAAAAADGDESLRARAYRAAGELGRSDLLDVCNAGVTEADESCRFWATWACVLLGERGHALRALEAGAATSEPHRDRALRLGVQAGGPVESHAMLGRVAAAGESKRRLVQCAGISGNPRYMPWLITQMEDPEIGGIAGEAFTTITGVDLVAAHLEGKRVVDRADQDEIIKVDEELPLPDPAKVSSWWDVNRARFPDDTRHFMGAPVTREHCIKVLKTGYQRQRILAAHYLCLLEPGTPLFNTSAPAWRQQRWLAKM
jgi:uncharacterized protein (TIGR02270 family)